MTLTAEIRSTYRANRTQLHLAHLVSTNPCETVDLLIDRIGYTAAADIVAVMVIAKGEKDGRISRTSREWAKARLEDLTKEDLTDAYIYYCDDIHPAHMEQIASEMIAVTPPETVAEDPVADAVDMLEEDSDMLRDILEDLDDWCGYLGDDRWLPMEAFNECLCDRPPLEIASLVIGGDFNPNHDFFRFDVWGDIVTTNDADYLGFEDASLVRKILRERDHLTSLSRYPRFCALLDRITA